MRTKIVATLGPASMNPDVMKDMVRNGARIFRFNFSHSNAEQFKPVVAMARQIENELDIPLTLMGDLCGPKTRIGEVAGSPLQIAKSEIIYLGLPDEAGAAGEGHFISLDFPELLKGLEAGMPVSLSDGMLQFKVTEVVKQDRLFKIKANNGGLLTSHKGIAFPGKFHPTPALTEKDRTDLHEGLDIGLDAFALSFVQSLDDIVDIKGEIAKHGANVPVVAKIERQNAVDNIDSILGLADAIMVARGDLGLECPMYKIPVIQKKLIRAARHVQKPAIVATQMLLSMVKNPIPTRAEVSDVANAVLDGADCVMLSEETAIGNYPGGVVESMGEICKDAERYFLERLGEPYKPKMERNPVKFLAYSACLLAWNADARALVCHTMSGSTARILSSRRPGHSIYAITPDQEALRSLNFVWGVHPRLIQTDTENHMERAQKFIQHSEIFRSGDTLIITSGQPTPGSVQIPTNELKIYTK